MAIPYWTTKFKSTNMAIWGPTAKFNSHQYFWLYRSLHVQLYIQATMIILMDR